jgi:Flp pilus assembly protein TadD
MSHTALPKTRGWPDAALAVTLAVCTCLVFQRALGCGFINFDDPHYVTRNSHVTAGLTLDGLRWAFTTVTPFAWCPLTWLSLQADASLWWPNPKGFLLTNVLLHSANAALVFLALRSLTGSRWRSALAALLFALHPLRVESVAWVTERKDVLSSFFGLLALWSYAGYVRRPSAARYAAVAATFALSLMAKPMLVTLPFLLLVLDWWPLARWQPRTTTRLLIEKVPLLALAFASAYVTYRGQEVVGVNHGLEAMTLAGRVANAVVSYILYLSKIFWPVHLALFYPHPLDVYGPHPGLPAWQVAGAALLLAAASAVAYALRKRVPGVLAGWLWYLGVFVPMIGLVQSGSQGFADRYSYFPQIGLLIALCWAIPDFSASRARLAVAASFATILMLVLVVLTQMRLTVWQDPVRLWRDSLEVTGPNLTTLENLAELLGDRGDNRGAVRCLREALRLDPNDFDAHLNLGTSLSQLGNLDEAAREFEAAIRIDPRSDGAVCNRGMVDVARGDLPGAATRFHEALAINPDSIQARANLAGVLFQQGKAGDAAREYEQAIALEPRNASLHFSLGRVLIQLGRLNDAAACFERALAIEPSSRLYRQALEACIR